MSKPLVYQIKLSHRLQTLLKQLSRQRKSPHWLVSRCRIILMSERNLSQSEIARQLGISRNTVRYWCQHWLEATRKTLDSVAPKVSGKTLRELVINWLRDQPRSGAPNKFSPEQVVQIVAVSCESPQDSQRPISHWSARELADEVIARAIVPKISKRTVGRILAEADLKPHRSKNWINTPQPDAEAFQKQVSEVCQLYLQAGQLSLQNIYVVSVDEMTGIQALERIYATQPPGVLVFLNAGRLNMSGMELVA